MKKECSLSHNENLTFRALYLIAIVLVVDGHTTLDDMFGMGDLSRYYSFHLMLFAFGAGYFFTCRACPHGGRLPRIIAGGKYQCCRLKTKPHPAEAVWIFYFSEP